jgi:hypothetical protein
MNRVKWLHVSLLFLLVLGLALPAVAQEQRQLADSQEPGSVIIFPKFINGTFEGEPKSYFEISVTCPRKNPDGSCALAEKSPVKLKAHWVCPGTQDFTEKFVCAETDFNLFTTLFGTLVFSPSNVNIGNTPAFPTSPLTPSAGGIVRVPAPPCDQGYLIAWVVNNNDQPIKYDALVGDAVIRDTNGAVSAYNGIPIQAHSGLTTTDPIRLGPNGGLPFTGEEGQYKAVTSVVQGSVRFDAPVDPGPAVTTDLTLLTLDVHSNRPNYPTFVSLNFYNANEINVSTYHEFVCWTEIALSNVNGAEDFINSNLTATGMGTLKGLVVSEPAFKIPFAGIEDTAGQVTLLGIVTTSVFNGTSYAYSYSLYNDSIPFPTTFDPVIFFQPPDAVEPPTVE